MAARFTLDEKLAVVRETRRLLNKGASWVKGTWRCVLVDNRSHPVRDAKGRMLYAYCLDGAINQAVVNVLGLDRAVKLGAVSTDREGIVFETTAPVAHKGHGVRAVGSVYLDEALPTIESQSTGPDFLLTGPDFLLSIRKEARDLLPPSDIYEEDSLEVENYSIILNDKPATEWPIIDGILSRKESQLRAAIKKRDAAKAATV